MTDSFGRPIDGNHDGQPGGDFAANLKGKKVTVLGAPQAQAVTNVSAMALDVLMQDSNSADRHKAIKPALVDVLLEREESIVSRHFALGRS